VRFENSKTIFFAEKATQRTQQERTKAQKMLDIFFYQIYTMQKSKSLSQSPKNGLAQATAKVQQALCKQNLLKKTVETAWGYTYTYPILNK
jgi:hypothetical protein